MANEIKSSSWFSEEKKDFELASEQQKSEEFEETEEIEQKLDDCFSENDGQKISPEQQAEIDKKMKEMWLSEKKSPFSISAKTISIILLISALAWWVLNKDKIFASLWEQNSSSKIKKWWEKVPKSMKNVLIKIPTWEIEAKKDLHSILLSIFLNSKNLTKEDLKLFDENYSKLKFLLWDDLEKKVDNFLLKAYISMFKTGFSVDWYEELQQLSDKIEGITQNKIKVRWGKWINTEFTENIFVSGEIKNNQFVIDKSNSWQEKFAIDNVAKMLKQTLDDIVKSVPTSLNDILKEKWDSLEKILKLEIKIGELQTINKILKTANLELEKNNKELLQKSWKELEKSRKSLDSTINDYENKLKKTIEELEKNHKEELKKLWIEKSDFLVELTNLKDKLDKSIAQNNKDTDTRKNLEVKISWLLENIKQTEKLNNEQLDWLNKKILELKKIIENKDNIINSKDIQIEKIKQQLKEENIKLMDKISYLEDKIHKLNNSKNTFEIYSKTKQETIASLMKEKQDLIDKNRKVVNALKILLKNTENNLNNKIILSSDLKDKNNKKAERIKELIDEVKTLTIELEKATKIAKRVEKVEAKLVDYNEKVKKIEELKAKSKLLEIKRSSLESKLEKNKSDEKELIEIRKEQLKNEKYIEKLEKNTADLVAKNSDLETKLSIAEEDLGNKLAKIQQLESEVKSGQENINYLNEFSKNIEETLEKKIGKKFNLKIQKLEEENKKLEAEIERLKESHKEEINKLLS